MDLDVDELLSGLDVGAEPDAELIEVALSGLDALSDPGAGRPRACRRDHPGPHHQMMAMTTMMMMVNSFLNEALKIINELLKRESLVEERGEAQQKSICSQL